MAAALPRLREPVQTPATWRLTPAQRLVRYRYVATGSRDLRLDLLRGYCVFAMTVDHLDAPTWLYVATGGNRFFVSAAEGFLFISGLVMAIVYRPIVEQRGLRVAASKAGRRALLLYLVTVGATLGFMWLSGRLGLPWAAGVDLLEAAPRVLLLERTFYLTDVLLLYTFLLAIAPAAFYLLSHGRTWLLLGTSWGLWSAHQVSPIDMPWPSEEGAFFYIVAWQLLFFNALALGWHRQSLARRFAPLLSLPVAALTAAGVVGLYVLWRWGSVALGRYYADGGAVLYAAFAKWNLPPGRLVACVIVFGFFFLVSHLFWVPLRRAVGWLFLPLGQSALSAYVVQLFVVAMLTAYRDHTAQLAMTSPARGTVFQLLAILVLWLLLTAWVRGRRLVAALSSQSALERRIDPALAVVFAAVLALGIAITPFPAAPVAGFVNVRDDRNSIDEPHYLIHVPPDASHRQPLPVLALLHDLDEDAESFGDELVTFSDREGWLLVAPRLPYGADARNPQTIIAESPGLLRGLHDILGELPANTALRIRRRVVLFGYGRGASMAQRFALSYPHEVLGVALLGGGGYTLPPGPDRSLDAAFPFGVKGMVGWTDHPSAAESARQVHYWVGVGADDSDAADTSRAWDPYLGVTRVERAGRLAQALRVLGAPTEYELFASSGHALTGEMRHAVAEFTARLRAVPAQSSPRLPRGARER